MPSSSRNPRPLGRGGCQYDWMTVNNRHFPLFAVDARQKDDVLLIIEALIASLEVQSVTTEIE